MSDPYHFCKHHNQVGPGMHCRSCQVDAVDSALELVHKAQGHQESRWRDCDKCNALASVIYSQGGPLL